MEFYSNKLTLEYHRMFLEYVAEKDAKKVQKLNGMSKPPEGEQPSIIRDIDIESTLTDEGEETTSSSSSEDDSDGDNSYVQESSREGEDSSSSTVIYEREKDESSEKTKNENESSADVGEDNGTEEDVEETNQISENGGETNRKSEDDSSTIGRQSQLVKTLEEFLDVEMKEDTTKEDSKKEDEAAEEEASIGEDGTRQSQLVKVLKELSEVEGNKEDTAEEVTKNGNEAAEEVDSIDEISDSDNDFRIKICKRPDTFLKVMKKDLIDEIQKDLLEDLIELDRTKEDDVNTDKFIESIENSLKAKRNDEDVDIFEEKERSSNSTASGIVSQDVLVEDKEKGSFSDGSQTLTADSKTLVPESQSLLQSEDTDKKYSKVLEIKKTVLASSSDEDDSSQEDSGEPASETEESESEEESKESDSEIETGKKKTKKAVRNSEKRKRFVSSDGSSDKEERELNKLTNLNTLKRRKLIFDSTEDENEEEETAKEKSKATPKNTEKKSKQKSPVETLLDMYSDSSNSESEAEKKANEEDEETDPMKFVWKNTIPTIKSLVLATSDSSLDDSHTSEEDTKKEEKPKEEPKKEKKKYQQKNKPSWKNDPLLRDELSSEEEQRRWKEKQQKNLSSPPVVEIISDSSDADNFRPSATEKKKKRKRHDVKISDVSSSESEVEQHTPVKSQDTPSKGRKNIKKILKKDSLMLETRQALRAETERKKRLAARNKIYNELFAKDDKQLVLDFDPQTKKPLLKVDKALVAHLKPHQREGVKFMWDCCFESLKRLEEDSGSGCILAHCMGLGKTLQAVTLVHTLLNNDTGVQTVLIVCPLNTVSNWQNEFVIWLKNLNGKKIRVFAVNQFNKHFQRSETLQSWQRDGGVMIISYEMFRRLTGVLKQSPHKKHGPVYEKTLLDPGPDLVICDEGHKIKNQETALSKNMRKIKTLRRVILTGTPLQNNLKEYYWMVNFVKPNILGSKKEFNNRFINPIHNGQFKDSTVLDVKIMKKRSHVLHSMLDGCIQRINYDIASPYLPEKHEYVIYICLTETQAKLYDYYLHQFSKRGLEKVKSASLFNDFHSLQRVCTHPHVLLAYAKKPNEEEETAPPPKTQTPSVAKFFTPSATTDSTDEVATNLTNLNGAVLTPAAPLNLPSSSKPQIPVDWWKGMVEEREFEDPYASGKLCLLWSILEYCQKIGDKLLVFSQSLQTLNLIEYFLKKLNESGAETWIENLDYFKLTGTTSLENRTKACKKFNKSDNQRGRLFLISTRAGGLGINLIAANRVIIFDASWNPSHDVQSIFRVYRFGQEKTCYIYRFLAEATMEEKIYDRQITKLSLSDRVVDEHQIERHFTLGNLTELYNYEPIPPDQWETPMVPKDLLLAEILAAHKDIIVRVLEHDSLLENKEEEELTEEERQAAWEEFEKEKFADNRGIASPLANSNSNVQPGASPVAYNGSVLDMLDILKNTTGNTPPGPSVVPNPFANGGSPSRRLPGSAPSSPVTKTPAAAPAINFSNETMAQRFARPAQRKGAIPTSASRDSASSRPLISSERIRLYTDKLMRLGRIVNLKPHENEKLEDFEKRLRDEIRKRKLSFLLP